MAVGIGDNCYVQIADGASGAYVTVTNVFNISPPVEEQKLVEYMPLSGATRSVFATGTIGLSAWTFELYFTDNEYARLVGLRGSTKNFKIVWYDGANAVVSSTITKVTPKIGGRDDIPTITVDLQQLGAIAFTEN